MSLEDDIAIISSAALFDDLSQEQLKLLAFGTERLRIAEGRVIFREGDFADCAYLISNGQVTLSRLQDSAIVPVKTVGSGTLLGEMALITETTRFVTATASAPTEMLRINRALFRRMLSEYPETAAALHRRMAENLKSMLSEIARLDSRFRSIPDL